MLNRFKKWVTTSKRVTPPVNPSCYWGPDWADEHNDADFADFSLNPFKGVIESSAYPMAKIYREGFWMGIADTYNVITGNHYTNSVDSFTGNKYVYTYGVLDILIFPLIARALITWGEGRGKDGHHQSFGSSLCGSLGMILELPRFILGAALTLALSPIVALVHIFSYSFNLFLITKIIGTLH